MSNFPKTMLLLLFLDKMYNKGRQLSQIGKVFRLLDNRIQDFVMNPLVFDSKLERKVKE